MISIWNLVVDMLNDAGDRKPPAYTEALNEILDYFGSCAVVAKLGTYTVFKVRGRYGLEVKTELGTTIIMSKTRYWDRFWTSALIDGHRTALEAYGCTKEATP